MIAITFLPALGFGLLGLLIGIYGTYLLFGWAMSEDDEYVPNKMKLDDFEERLSK
jgi:hypothetical protein